jgi:hypothetical protein
MSDIAPMIAMTESLVNTKTGGTTDAAQVAVFACVIRDIPRTIREKMPESAKLARTSLLPSVSHN